MKRILLLLIPLLASCANRPAESDTPHHSAVELLREYHQSQEKGLDEWQMIQLAIIWTESKGNANAVGNAGDSGCLQLRECYINEVNRLYGTTYTIEDAFDIDKSLEMFSLMQAHYNPRKDIDTAIYFHNKSEAYRREVLRNYELVKRMETVRQKLIEQ